MRAWCLGVAAAIVFLALSTVELDRQGMYYDEVHQAPAAFFYIGERPAMFIYPVFEVPVLNMAYSGAIKSAVYGAYLVCPETDSLFSAGGCWGFCSLLRACCSSIGLLQPSFRSQAPFCFSLCS